MTLSPPPFLRRLLFRRGHARLLSAYVDSLVVKRRSGRDRPLDPADEPESIEELIDLVQLLSTIDIAMPAGFGDRLAREIAAQAETADQAMPAPPAEPARTPAAAAVPPHVRLPLRAPVPPSAPTPATRGLLTRWTAWRPRPEGSRRWLVAATAVGLTIGLVVMDLRQPTLSAAELLRHSVDAARIEDRRPGIVTHRVMRLEQRDLQSGALIGRRKIDIWERPDERVKARRAYDERHRLVAGEWQRGHELRTVYVPGRAKDEISSPDELEAQQRRAPLDARAVWQLDVSAADFLALLPDPARARVTMTSTTYVVAYDSPEVTTGLVRASLTLRKDGLWPVRQTLVVYEGGALSEFRFEEAALERMPGKAVSARVFEPDAGLWAAKTPPLPAPAIPRVRVAPAPVVAVVPSVPEGRLLLDAWFRVHRLDACLDERTTIDVHAGTVAVHAAVTDENRRMLLLRAFDSFTPTGHLALDVEAPPDSADAPGSASVTGTEAPEVHARFAAWQAVREHYRSRVGFLPEQEIGPQLDAATREFARWVVERSARRVQEARALNRHLAPWTPERLAALDLDARAAWISMVRQHARAFRQETELLRVQLQSVFLPVAPGDVMLPSASTPSGSAGASDAPQEQQGSENAGEDERGGVFGLVAGGSESGGSGPAEDARLVRVCHQLLLMAEREDQVMAAAFLSASAAVPPFGEADVRALVTGLARAERLAAGFDAPQWLDR